jgi:hypothetical protein
LSKRALAIPSLGTLAVVVGLHFQHNELKPIYALDVVALGLVGLLLYWIYKPSRRDDAGSGSDTPGGEYPAQSRAFRLGKALHGVLNRPHL